MTLSERIAARREPAQPVERPVESLWVRKAKAGTLPPKRLVA